MAETIYTDFVSILNSAFKSTVSDIWCSFCLVDFQKKSIILESKNSEVLFG